MVDAAIDAPPTKEAQIKEEEEEEMPEPPPEGSPWKEYLKPYWISILMGRNKLIYGLSVTLWYLTQFIGCVTVINLYSDKDRKNICDTIKGDFDTSGMTEAQIELKEAEWGEQSSEVFDFPLLMLAIYHIGEWIRTTVLLTVVCIGVNWTVAWYATTFWTLFGIVVYAITHMVYLSEDGKSCKEVQEYRAVWLLCEIIAFWALFFCFIFPMCCTLIMGKRRANDTLQKWKEDNAEEEE